MRINETDVVSATAKQPRRHRRIRLIIALLLVLVVLGAVDQVARLATERQLGSRIQDAEGLDLRPDVNITGFPFLTQVIDGRYRSVELGATSTITAQGISIDHARATLDSVQVDASDALHGTVPNLPVRAGSGSAVVPYASIDTAVRQYGGSAGSLVTVSGDRPGVARLDGPLGLTIAITAHVDDGKLLITPSASDLRALPEQVARVVTAALDAPVPLPAFPFNIHLTSGSFQSDGLHLGARSRNSVFPVR